MYDVSQLRAGDLFRIAVKDDKYCYGVVMAPIKVLKEQGKLIRSHHLLSYSDGSFFYRLYQHFADSPDLKAADLTEFPLGPAVICSNLQFEMSFTLIEHIPVTPELLEFPITAKTICYVSSHSQIAFMEALAPDDPYWEELFGVVIEWGTVQTNRSIRYISQEALDVMKKSCLAAYHSTWGISSDYAKTNDFYCRGRLILPEELDAYSVLFPCFNLPCAISFDDFAARYGGMTKHQLVELLNEA